MSTSKCLECNSVFLVGEHYSDGFTLPEFCTQLCRNAFELKQPKCGLCGKHRRRPEECGPVSDINVVYCAPHIGECWGKAHRQHQEEKQKKKADEEKSKCKFVYGKEYIVKICPAENPMFPFDDQGQALFACTEDELRGTIVRESEYIGFTNRVVRLKLTRPLARTTMRKPGSKHYKEVLPIVNDIFDIWLKPDTEKFVTPVP